MRRVLNSFMVFSILLALVSAMGCSDGGTSRLTGPDTAPAGDDGGRRHDELQDSSGGMNDADGTGVEG